jgi:hypothetical protein
VERIAALTEMLLFSIKTFNESDEFDVVGETVPNMKRA